MTATPAPTAPLGELLRSPLRGLRAQPGPPLRLAVLATLALAVPDLLRQLPVRTDASLAASLLVDAIGFLSGAVVQVGLVGGYAGAGLLASVPRGLVLLRAALRRRPAAVVAGLAAAGLVSALVTLPPSLAVLGRQVPGPLEDPALWRLVVAQASDVAATVVTATYWALLVVLLAGAQPYWRASAR